jgi:hypothetical protein
VKIRFENSYRLSQNPCSFFAYHCEGGISMTNFSHIPAPRRASLALLHLLFTLGVLCASLPAEVTLPQRVSQKQNESASKQPAAQSAMRRYLQVPLAFEPNRGQTDPRVKFVSRGQDYTMFLTGQDVVFALSSTAGKSSALQMTLKGAHAQLPVGLQPTGAISNYFIGNDPSKWRTDIPSYARVMYGQVYPGVDLMFYGNQRQLEYDFAVAPGASPETIRLQFHGARKIRILADGDLVLQTGAGDLNLHRPVVYQQDATGSRTDINAGFVLLNRHEIAFRVGSYDRSKPLVIDPVITYTTYLGGSNFENGFTNGTSGSPMVGIAVGSDGTAYLTGVTTSTDFPTANPFQSKFGGGNFDVFVTRFSADGTQALYSTYLGGKGDDFGGGIAIDAQGNAYLAGGTQSSDFPTTANAFQKNPASGSTGFVAKLSPTGDSLVYSTYLGGTQTTHADGIALDANLNAYVTGADTGGFPTTQKAFQKSIPGQRSPFVAKLSVDGSSLVYATYVGGSNDDSPLGIALDGNGHAYITGSASSPDFPTTNGAVQTTSGGDYDAFVTQLKADGSGLVYSTYLGGSGNDGAYGIAVDGSGSAYVTGVTHSANFPVASAQQPALDGPSDAFVTKLSPDGSAMVYSTYLGGKNDETGYAVAVDSLGRAYVTGVTSSLSSVGGFPTLYSLSGPSAAPGSAFITQYTPDGSAFVYSTLFGGFNEVTVGNAIALDSGVVYVTGYTQANDLPVTPNPGAFQTTLHGVQDAFAVKLWPLSISETVIDFGDVQLNTASPWMNSKMINSGFHILNIQNSTLGGANPDQFGEGGNCGPTLDGQSSCTNQFNFLPTKLGPLTATFSITDDASPNPQTITLKGNGIPQQNQPQAVLTPSSVPFGDQTVNTTSSTHVVTLSNPGTATLHITSITLTGANPSNFGLTNGCGVTLDPNQSCNLSVNFTPNATGPFSATITVVDDAKDSPQSVSLSGNGVAQQTAQAVLTPQGLSFGNQRVGTNSSAHVVVLSNPGNATLNITGIGLAGPNASSFSLMSGCGSTLAAGNSCNLTITFKPVTAGPLSAAIIVTDNASNSPQSAALSGTGTAPQARLSAGSISFGSQNTGTASAPQALTLSNPGTATLNVSSISIAGANAGVFSQTNNCASTLAPNGTCSIQVTFTPASAGQFAATLSVSDDAVGSPQAASLSGAGINTVLPQPDFSLTSPTTPQTVNAGGSVQYTIMVTSVNGSFNDPVNLSASGLPTGATATFSPVSVTPGGNSATSTLTVQTAPSMSMTRPGSGPFGRVPWGPLSSSTFIAGSVFLTTRNNRARASKGMLLLVAIVSLMISGLSACGGGSPSGQKAPQNYSITVTGDGGSMQHTTSVSLTVQ